LSIFIKILIFCVNLREKGTGEEKAKGKRQEAKEGNRERGIGNTG
jgi:hypothetical protein